MYDYPYATENVNCVSGMPIRLCKECWSMVARSDDYEDHLGGPCVRVEWTHEVSGEGLQRVAKVIEGMLKGNWTIGGWII